MNRKRIALIGLIATGVLILGWVPLAIYTNSGPTKTQAVVDDRHCPVCGRELPRFAGGECPYCKIEGNGELAKSAMRRQSLATHPAIPAVLFSIFGILLTVNLVVFFRKRSVARREEESYYMNCPRCQRKLRFRESQMGRIGLCPLCKRPLLFPKLHEEHNRLAWLRRRLVHWVGASKS